MRAAAHAMHLKTALIPNDRRRYEDPPAVHREYHPEPMTPGQAHESHGGSDGETERRSLILTTVVVGDLLGCDVLLNLLGGESFARPFGIRLALVSAFIGGGRVVYLALLALLEGRIGADIALAIACLAAGLAGEYFVAAEVVFIALLGECLEALTLERAQRAIQKLLEYRPRTARLLRDGQEREVAADAVAPGDVLLVRPGERIAADGTVLRGRTAVDQSILTGESLPVDVGPGDRVFTGSINQFGQLEIRVEQVGSQTTMGRVIDLLNEAQRHKAPLERTADRLARRFLPAVLAATVLVFLATNAAGCVELDPGRHAPDDRGPARAGRAGRGLSLRTGAGDARGDSGGDGSAGAVGCPHQERRRTGATGTGRRHCLRQDGYIDRGPT